MQIFVRKVDGGTMAVRVEPRDTLAQVKRHAIPSSAASVLANEVYVFHGSQILADDSFVSDAGVRDGSTLTLGLRCRGGGGDGGATGAESRDCYLKMYADKKPDKFDPYESKLAKFTRCTISAESLKPPCVMDYVGNLYNKEAVVQALLTKSVPKKLRHVIKGLKDVIDIHLTSIPGVSADDESVETKFQCPVTGLEFNGKFRFVALKSCGHVLSEKALKEVKTAACLACYAPFKEADKIVVNGTEEEVIALRERWEEEKAKSRGEKKVKKSQDVRLMVTESRTEVAVSPEERADTQIFHPVAAHGAKRNPDNGVHVPQVVGVRPKGSDLIQPSKRFKAAEVLLPANATKEIFASIFTSSNKGSLKETYSCRSLPIGRN